MKICKKSRENPKPPLFIPGHIYELLSGDGPYVGHIYLCTHLHGKDKLFDLASGGSRIPFINGAPEQYEDVTDQYVLVNRDGR